jgi:O-antigen ligase
LRKRKRIREAGVDAVSAADSRGNSLHPIAVIPLVLSILWLPLADGGSNEAVLPIVEGLTFAALLWLFLKNRIEISRSAPLLAVLALTLVGAVISTAFSEDLDASVPLLIQWFWLGGTAMLALTVSRGRRGRELLLALLAAALLIQVLWSFYVWWGGRSPNRLQVGTFYAPNQFAGYVLLLAPLFLSMYLFAKGVLRNAGLAVLTTLTYLAILFSGSRGGVVAAIIGGLVAFVIAVKHRRWNAVLKGAALLVVFLLMGGLLSGVFLFPGETELTSSLPGVLSKPETVSLSAGARLRWAQGALQIGVNQPLTGSGLGTFGDKFSQIQSPDWRWSRYAHNDYLESFADGGILLLLASTALPIVVVVGVIKRLRAVGSDQLEWGIALLAGIVGASFHLLVEHDWSYPAFGSAFVVSAVVATKIGVEHVEHLGGRAGWRSMVAVPMVLSFIALAGLVLSRHLISEDRMSDSDDLAKAQLASALAPYSVGPRLVEADELVSRCESGDLNRAQRALSIASSIDELNPVIQWKLAFVMTQQGVLESARASYRQALEITPNSAEAYLRAASFELTVGEPSRAISILDKGIFHLQGTVNGSLVDSLRDLRERAPTFQPKETEHSKECSVCNSFVTAECVTESRSLRG